MIEELNNGWSARMANAMVLADKCWAKAMEVSPEFVEEYLTVAEEVLKVNKQVPGDFFRRACINYKVKLPYELHHNTWVSGPRFLEKSGWITKGERVVPQEAHNHMPSVTMWESTLYEGE